MGKSKNQKGKNISERESMLNCQWFVNILLVLDAFFHYFRFYFQFQIFLHNFIQHIDKIATFFRNHVSEIEIFQHLLEPFARFHEDFSGFGMKKKGKLYTHIFLYGGKKIVTFGHKICSNKAHHWILASEFICTSLSFLKCEPND